MERRRAVAVGMIALAMLLATMLAVLLRGGDDPQAASASSDGAEASAAAQVADATGEADGAEGLRSEVAGATESSGVADADGATSPGADMETPVVDAGPHEEWVSGVVSDADGKPIEGATVSLFAARMQFPVGMGGAGRATSMAMAPAGTGKTDAEGRYAIALDVAPPIGVSAVAEGRAEKMLLLYAGSFKRELDPWGRRTVRVDFALEPGARLAGRVVDDGGGAVEGASVELLQYTSASWAAWGRISRTATSDAAGNFVVEGIAPTACRLRLAREGFASVSHSVENVAEVRDWVLSRAGGAIAGRVVLGGTGDPVVGAVVEAWRGMPENMGSEDPVMAAATTGADGAFRIEPLEAGFWDVTASSGALRPVDADSPLGRRIVLGQEETVDGVVLTLGGGWAIEGIVVDASTGRPIEGARVTEGYTHAAGSLGAATGADGRFALAGVFGTKQFSGRLEAILSATKSGWAMKEEVRVPLSVDGAAPPTARIEMVPKVPVRGTVRTADGSPAPRVPVTLYDRIRPGEVDFTDERGRFELAAPTNARTQVQATVGELKSHSQPFDVKDEAIDGVDVALDPGGTLVVRCVDEEGKPVGDATVWMMLRTYAIEGWSSSMRDGRKTIGEPVDATFEALPTTAAVLPMDLERWSLDVGVFSETWRDEEERSVELKPRETTTVTLTLKPKDATHFIDGIVVDWEERPVEGAVLQAWGDHGRGDATTDALGMFRMEKLSPGEYHVSVSHPKFLHGSADQVAADTSDVRIVLPGPRTRWVARVVDAETGETLGQCEPKLVPNDAEMPKTYTHFDDDDRTLIVGGLLPGVPRRVTVEAEGYEPQEIDALVPEGATFAEGTVSMRRAAGP